MGIGVTAQSICSFSGPTGEGMRAFPAFQPRVFVCGCVYVCGGPAGELCSGELERVGGKHLERACHSAARSSARVHTKYVLDSWVTVDTACPLVHSKTQVQQCFILLLSLWTLKH